MFEGGLNRFLVLRRELWRVLKHRALAFDLLVLESLLVLHFQSGVLDGSGLQVDVVGGSFEVFQLGEGGPILAEIRFFGALEVKLQGVHALSL